MVLTVYMVLNKYCVHGIKYVLTISTVYMVLMVLDLYCVHVLNKYCVHGIK